MYVGDYLDSNLGHEVINLFKADNSLGGQTVRNLSAMWETQVRFLCWEVSLEKGMATHSSILAWRIP